MKIKLNTFFVALVAGAVFAVCGGGLAFGQAKSGIKTIVIDPGHGGKDPGTVHGQYKEKDINLSVALMLGDMIKKNFPDVKVLYTRTKDVFVELNARSEVANKNSADLFLSIHVNAVDKGKTAPSGALTLVMGDEQTNANLDVAMRENDVIRYEEDQTIYEGYIPGSVESFIIFSLMQYAHLDQSMNFASIIQKHYKKSTPIPDRGARQQRLLVLWKTAMPSVLTELGFLSNPDDRKVLTSEAGQKKMAAALFNAFSEYKSRIEGNSAAIELDVLSGVSTVSVGLGSNSSPRNTEPKEKIVYRIQVCVSKQQLGRNGSMLKKYKNMGVAERYVDSMYKYYVGECFTYSEAAELQKKIRRTTPDAFMVAFRGDTQVSVSEARRETR